jgi:hypothetical protein
LFGVVVLPLPEVPPEVPPDSTGLPVILSYNNFVPAPIAAPVSAFTTLLEVEFGLLTLGLTVGLTTDVGDVVLVVGVVGVLFVMVGFAVVAGLVVEEVIDVFGVKVVFGAKVVFGTEEVFVVMLGFVVAGFVNAEVNGRVPEPLDVIEEVPLSVIEGALSTPRIMLSSGARSSPLALGICLLDVRFFRIAMFYPVFFSMEVKFAILPTGVSFALLANVFGGCAG